MTKEELKLQELFNEYRKSDCQSFTDFLINKIAELEKENAELKNKDCWKSCEYANPKAELIGQHIKDVQNLTKAKEIIKTLLLIADNKVSQMEFQLCVADAKQFLNSEVEK